MFWLFQLEDEPVSTAVTSVGRQVSLPRPEIRIPIFNFSPQTRAALGGRQATSSGTGEDVLMETPPRAGTGILGNQGLRFRSASEIPASTGPRLEDKRRRVGAYPNAFRRLPRYQENSRTLMRMGEGKSIF